MYQLTAKTHGQDPTRVFEAIQSYLPDILLALRDNNAKTRRFSQEFLIQMG